jgi:hypothetical protein
LKYTTKLSGELSGSQQGLLGYTFRLIFAGEKKKIHESAKVCQETKDKWGQRTSWHGRDGHKNVLLVFQVWGGGGHEEQVATILLSPPPKKKKKKSKSKFKNSVNIIFTFYYEISLIGSVRHF